MGFDYEILFLKLSKRFLSGVLKKQGGATHWRKRVDHRGHQGRKVAAGRHQGKADVFVDTSDLALAYLKEKINLLYSPEHWEKIILITIISLGYKYGLPLDADLVLDVRFLPNPHYVESLRHLDGNHPHVHNYIWKWAITHRFFQKLKDMIQFLIPCYIREGKPQLVIAIGCTGGRHRSVSSHEWPTCLPGKLQRANRAPGYQ